MNMHRIEYDIFECEKESVHNEPTKRLEKHSGMDLTW